MLRAMAAISGMEGEGCRHVLELGVHEHYSKGELNIVLTRNLRYMKTQNKTNSCPSYESLAVLNWNLLR